MEKHKQQQTLVRVTQDDGTIQSIPFKQVKEHEESIIEDNCVYGLKCVYRNEITLNEVKEYERDAVAQFRSLKKRIREDPTVVLKIEPRTRRYVVDE
jgi:hypothetical protein